MSIYTCQWINHFIIHHFIVHDNNKTRLESKIGIKTLKIWIALKFCTLKILHKSAKVFKNCQCNEYCLYCVSGEGVTNRDIHDVGCFWQPWTLHFARVDCGSGAQHFQIRTCHPPHSALFLLASLAMMNQLLLRWQCELWSAVPPMRQSCIRHERNQRL